MNNSNSYQNYSTASGTVNKTIAETIAWLIRLGRPPLPECPLEAAKQGRTQKQPQFFDGKRVVPVSWQEWQKQQPIPEVYQAWFRHSATGIGTLGGWNGRHWLGWVDFDVDNFGSEMAMKEAIAIWFARYPEIANAPQFQSPSGGYRVLLAFEQEPDTGANNGFSFTPDDTKRAGELLIKNGGHTLLPPTMGANLKPYQWIKWSEYPPVFPSIGNAGLYPVKDAKQAERKGVERKPEQRSTNFQGQSLTEILERDIYPRLTADRLFGDLENWKGTEKNCWCPFCTTREKAPSFNVPSDKTTFLCYGCRVTGSWADYIMLRDRVEFKEAVIKLGAMVGVEIPSYTYAQNAQRSSKYQHQYADASNKGFGESQKKKLPLKDAAAKAREVLRGKLPELEENLELEEIREQCGMGSYDWTTKIIKPLKRDLEGERFKLELKGLLAIEDAIERLRQQALIAPRYSMNSATIEKALQIMKVKQGTPETRVWSLDDFLDQASSALDWVIPGFLPKGETILLIGAPKAGKSLLAFDAAFAVATGDAFLDAQCEEGRVLIVSVDESANSTKNKLLKRGFRRQDTANVRIIDKWDISQMATLEATLEDFRPSLVIVDSLKRITHGSEISENSAEFADNIYALKEIFTRYSASGILVHHAKKDKDAYGVDMARGSSAIAGATWGQWQIKQIPQPDPDNPKRQVIDPRNPERTFFCHSRDIEGEALSIWFNPDNNSFDNMGPKDFGEEATKEEEKEQGLCERIMRVLQLNAPKPLSGREIIESLELDPKTTEGRGVYTALGRLVSRRIISQFPASGDKRVNLYSVAPDVKATHQEAASPEKHPTENSYKQNPATEPEISTPPPSPPGSEFFVEYSPTIVATQSFEDTQQNTQQNTQQIFSSTTQKMGVELLDPWLDEDSSDTQHPSSDEGGEGGKNSPTVTVVCDSECVSNLTEKSTTETGSASSLPAVGALVWRSPIPSEWNPRTKQRKPAQPGCVCRVVQVNNNGAIARCELDGSQFHVSWHAWQSGLFAPYCGQDK